MRLAFVFAGQGSQYLKMGESFYKNSQEFRDYIKFLKADDLLEICLNDENKLNQTEFSQPCIFLISQAITHLLKKANISCECCCGLSLGEYNALVCANVLSDVDALEIVRKRGQLMQNAFKNKNCKMTAIIYRDIKVVESAVNSVSEGVCEISNYNCSNQCVISGDCISVEKVKALLEGKVLKMVDLNVSGAFHCSLLDDTSKVFDNFLTSFNFDDPKIKVASNYTGKFEYHNFKELLVNQLNHSVQFNSNILEILKEDIDMIVEIGPKKVLSGFIKKIDRHIKVMNIDTYDDYLKFLEVIKDEKGSIC